RAIELLGSIADPTAVPVLAQALSRGEWWAPRRTRLLRSAAAGALAKIDDAEARRALDGAASRGPRGVRTAARAAREAEPAARRTSDVGRRT
ncbi:MAG TPA: HEAT repeat domain-containing protein, partial [Vicinamibacterales bacterium]|nr:HEAT repeat domain-containing protein [Vicinamibacterales bacterium]